MHMCVCVCVCVCVCCAGPRWRFYTGNPTLYVALQEGCREIRCLRYVEKQSAWLCVACVAISQTMRFSRTSYSSIILLNHVARPGSFNIRGERGVNVVERSHISILSLKYERKFPKKALVHGRIGQKWFIFRSGSLWKAKMWAEKTWLCCPLTLVVQWTKIIRTTDINNTQIHGK